MVYHRYQAQFDLARWRTALLLPIWTAQIAMLLGLMGIFSYRLAETVENFEDNDAQGNVPMVELVWECVNVGLSLVCLILTIMEIAKLATETLTPFFMLCTHVLKMTCVAAILALDVVVFLNRTSGEFSVIGLAVDGALMIFTLIPAVYSITTYRRVIQYDDYHHPANAKHYGFGTADTELSNSSGSGRWSRLSLSHPRSHSTSSLPPDNMFSRNPSTSTSRTSRTDSVALRPPLAGRSVSYDHRRDTQFETYMAHRASLSLKENIEQAMGAEFGWGGVGPSGGMDRSNSVVGSGVVISSRVRPRGDSGGRPVSWAGESALVAVPEEDGMGEEDRESRRGSQDEGEMGTGARGEPTEEDREALLGPERTAN